METKKEIIERMEKETAYTFLRETIINFVENHRVVYDLILRDMLQFVLYIFEEGDKRGTKDVLKVYKFNNADFMMAKMFDYHKHPMRVFIRDAKNKEGICLQNFGKN